jgi:serine/threonine-protein kinase
MLTPNLRLLSLLGKGGMGSVWLAEHLVLKTEVAVKLLSPDLLDHEEAIARFRREATAIAQLKSPHVVRIHDVGSAEGTPFFVMERLEGEDLSHRLDRVKRLPLGVVTAILVQMCKALSRVHELGVVHRDLKPGNVFLTDVDGDLVVKLVDFGIAKQADAEALNATSDGAVLGTPVYMSPEQVLSTKDVTATSDLYSLGVVVYECLAGEPPFSGETLGALHVAIANGRYTPITSVDPALPKSLDVWFARAFSPDPTRRFASAQEMAETFMVAARGRSSFTSVPPTDGAREWSGAAVAAPASGPESSGAWLRALPMVVGGLAVVALVGGIFLGLQSRSHGGAKSAAAPVTATAPVTVTSAGAGAVDVGEANAEAKAHAEAEANANANADADDVEAKATAVRAKAAAPAGEPAARPAKGSASPRAKKDRGF